MKNVNGFNKNYKCYKKGYNIENYDNKGIIKTSIFNNLKYMINYFSKYKNIYNNINGFSYTSPIFYKNHTFGYCSLDIKNIPTKYESLYNIIEKIKENCINNDFSQGYFDNYHIRICYDIINPNINIFKRRCYKSP
jgi:hypothetical protein